MLAYDVFVWPLQDSLAVLGEGLLRWEWERLTVESLVLPLAWPLAVQLVEVFALPINMVLLVSYLRLRSPDLVALAVPPTVPLPELQVSGRTAQAVDCQSGLGSRWCGVFSRTMML
jgi:hypothetical protein